MNEEIVFGFLFVCFMSLGHLSSQGDAIGVRLMFLFYVCRRASSTSAGSGINTFNLGFIQKEFPMVRQHRHFNNNNNNTYHLSGTIGIHSTSHP